MDCVTIPVTLRLDTSESVSKRNSIWRWRVVLAKFIVSFLAFGIYKSFGVLLPYLVTGLESDVTAIGWGYGFYGGLIYLLGPVAGAFTHCYSARRVVIIGGCVALIGLIAASVVNTSIELALTLILSGLGHGLMILPSVQPIAVLFPEGFALANGIALGGASIGMVVLPPLTEKLVEVNGWRGALLIIAAIDAHAILAGLLMKVPKETTPPARRRGVYTKLTPQKTTTTDRSPTANKPSLLELLAKAFDVQLFGTEPLIIFYDVIILLFAFVYSTWTVFLVPRAISRGISAKKASLLSTVAGFTNFFGRIGYAPVVDIVDSRDMFAVMSAILAALFLFDPFFNTFEAMACSAAVAGMFIGAGNSLWTVMIKVFVDECGSGSFVSTLGWACMFSGAGSLISSPITGWIYEQENDYDTVFQMMGILSAVIFLLLSAVRISQRYIT